MKNTIQLLAVCCAWLTLTACGGDNASAPLEPLASIYAEMAENNQKMEKAFQAVYAEKDKTRQLLLQQQADGVAKRVIADNKALGEKIAAAGEALQGKTMDCEAVPGADFSIQSAAFTVVQAGDKLANIVMTVTADKPLEGKYRFRMENKDGDVVYESLASTRENGTLALNFRITTHKGPEMARTLTTCTKIVIVPNGETAAVQAGEADNTDNEPEEAEPAYEGETPAQPAGKSVTAAGVTITVGAPLAETIRRAGKVTWDYNADYGVTCTIGNVWIVIPDEDLTEKGQSIINAILSDMENNISFSADYIRPEAKIKSFETN